MMTVRVRRALLATGTLTVAFGVTTASASAPPVPAEGTAVASALTNPRGFTWDGSGQLVVALAGSGGTNPPTEDTPTNAVIGPRRGAHPRSPPGWRRR